MEHEEPPVTKAHDPHIVRRYDAELVALRKLVSEMGALAVTQASHAVDALKAGDVSAARNVVAIDKKLNYLDIDGKEMAAALFAIRSPVAKDMRLVLSMYNTVDILERVGDEAKGIASVVVRLFEADRMPPTSEQMRDVTHLAALSVDMLERSLKALHDLDMEQAVEVVRCEETIDTEFRSALRRLSTFIIEDIRNLKHAIDMVVVFKGLERIGDYAKNISENLIYTIKGKDVRHMHPDTLSGGYLDT